MLSWTCYLHNANRPKQPPEIIDQILIVNDGSAPGAGHQGSTLGNYRLERRRPMAQPVLASMENWPRQERDALALLIAAAPRLQEPAALLKDPANRLADLALLADNWSDDPQIPSAVRILLRHMVAVAHEIKPPTPPLVPPPPHGSVAVGER